MAAQPPEEIPAGAVTLRRWQNADVEVLHEAVLDSADHLRPWMPWAAGEPVTLEDRRERIRAWIESWEAGEEYAYAIEEEGRVVGACSLVRRIGEGGLEIGYWVRPEVEGRGVAGAAAGALTAAAFGIDGVTHVEIHHDVANVRSGRIPERLGFEHIEDRPDEVLASGEAGVERIWRRDRERAEGDDS
jgi:ribosomal-protein-serine acetyltransferase